MYANSITFLKDDKTVNAFQCREVNSSMHNNV